MKNLSLYLDKLNISLSSGQLQQLEMYYGMVIETNKVMNLTAITDEDEFALKHIADSLSIAAILDTIDFSKGLRVIDIGTGAGFPGIPLKIAFPNLSITLLDSLRKRVGFLNEVISSLGLSGIEAIHSRAEDAARDTSYRESFDFAVSRAVAALPVLSEYCIPFVKKGGMFIAYKSGDITEELGASEKALRILGGDSASLKPFSLPDSDISRSFVIVNKVRPTPKRYPRKAGSIKKEPIS